MVILDTNILIDHLRQHSTETKLDLLTAKHGSRELSVSVTTVQELFAGASSKVQKSEISKMLSHIKIWPYTKEVAQKAGEIERDYKNGIEFADAAIAATCLLTKGKLVTLNTKDFVGIPNLDLLY